MSRRKKKKHKSKTKQGANMASTQYSTLSKTCKPHQQWLAIGKHKVFLKSSGGQLDPEVQVFIDLTGGGYYKREIPAELQHLFPKRVIVMDWELRDGSVCEELPGMVVTLLENGYTVGWGCIGGHGRTGWLAAAVLQALTGCTGDEAVDYVRKNYCKDAIETRDQLDELGSSRAPSRSYYVYQTPAKVSYLSPISSPRKYPEWNMGKKDKEMTEAELEKALEPIDGESDEDYDKRTDPLIQRWLNTYHPDGDEWV